MITAEPQSPIVRMDLGGVPPLRLGGELYGPLFDEILGMPDDGCWLRVEMRTAKDAERAMPSVRKWAERNSDQIDCRVEMRRGPANVLWVRKNLAKNPRRRGASGS